VLIPFIRLAIEANEVIGLRMMKIISGGPDAMTEIQLMFTEKINASPSWLTWINGGREILFAAAVDG